MEPRQSPLTHPRSYDFSHCDTFSTFQRDLDRALQGVFPAKPGKYDGVYILLINWEDNDLDCASEITALELQFQKQFHFETKKFSISSLDLERILADKLSDWERAHRSGFNLLIMYYRGHGHYDSQDLSIWRALVICALRQVICPKHRY